MHLRPVALSLALCLVSAPAHAARKRVEVDDRPPGPSTLSRVRVVPLGDDDPILRPGSRSVGACGDGYVFRSARLAPEDASYRVIPSYLERELFYGTDELVAAISRVAARVRQRYADAVLSVGNLGGRYGGPIRYSRSHQSGRDVDLAFYMTDADGRPAEADELVRFRCNGESRDADRRHRFDVARNWELIAALLRDDEIELEQVFVASCLRGKLLDHAEEAGADEELRRRAGLVLRLAGEGSYAHDDHFHVRIACSEDDLLSGCQNSRRAWGWSRFHEERLQDGEHEARRALGAEAAGERRAALRSLLRLDAKSSGAQIARLIDDADPGVRAAAHETLRALAPPSALPFLRGRLAELRDATRVPAILVTLASFQRPSPKTERLLLEILREPRAALTVRLSAEETAAAQALAARALRHLGTKASLRRLIDLLAAPDEARRAAAREALPYVANRPLGDQEGEAPEELQRRWLRWWREAGGWPQWKIIRQGFRDAGFDVPRVLWRWEAARPLYDAIAGGGPASWHAQHLLRHFARDTGPRIPQDHPERALPLWTAWLGSRLPIGALDQDTGSGGSRSEGGD